MAKHRDRLGGVSEVVDDFDDIGKLGQGFPSVNELEEINLG
jgi:hypothetical protein